MLVASIMKEAFGERTLVCSLLPEVCSLIKRSNEAKDGCC